MCSRAIFKSLEKVNFIDKVNANIAESSFEITFKKDAVVDLDAIRKAVEDAGFSVAKLQFTAHFDNTAIDNDVMVKVDNENLHFLNVNAQTLSGDKVLTVVDQHFVSDKEHKKYAQYTTIKCFTTGTVEACCSKGGSAKGKRMYHVTI